jgi:hypothetical protein
VNSMSRDLVRQIERERVAGARHRRLVRETKLARRSERRAQRRAGRDVSGRWWCRLARLVPEKAVLAAAPVSRPEAEALAVLLGAIAERVAEQGTASERDAVQAVHDAVRWSAPGAAAALVDRESSETLRLRAFGVAHGVVLSVLGPEDRAWLLDRLCGGTADESGDLVA